MLSEMAAPSFRIRTGTRWTGLTSARAARFVRAAHDIDLLERDMDPFLCQENPHPARIGCPSFIQDFIVKPHRKTFTLAHGSKATFKNVNVPSTVN